jgi:hypothetical protein
MAEITMLINLACLLIGIVIGAGLAIYCLLDLARDMPVEK